MHQVLLPQGLRALSIISGADLLFGQQIGLTTMLFTVMLLALLFLPLCIMCQGCAKGVSRVCHCSGPLTARPACVLMATFLAAPMSLQLRFVFVLVLSVSWRQLAVMHCRMLSQWVRW